MPISRKTVNAVRYVLEDILPPFLRDSRLFVPIMYLAFGRHARRHMSFRSDILWMSDEEYAGFYARLKPLMGETDLNRACADRILEELEGDRIADIGCGRGFLAGKIARLLPGGSCHGVDIAPPSLADAPDNLTFSAGWAGRLPFEDKAFDTVICSHTLEHLIDFDGALADLRRIARRRLILVVPREREYKYSLNLHVHFFPYPHTFVNRVRPPTRDFVCEVIDGDIYYREDIARAPPDGELLPRRLASEVQAN